MAPRRRELCLCQRWHSGKADTIRRTPFAQRCGLGAHCSVRKRSDGLLVSRGGGADAALNMARRTPKLQRVLPVSLGRNPDCPCALPAESRHSAQVENPYPLTALAVLVFRSESPLRTSLWLL